MCLYDHLVSLLSSIDNSNNTKQSFDNIETLSHFLKMNKFVHKHPKTDKELQNFKKSDAFGVQQFNYQCEAFIKVKIEKNDFLKIEKI